MCAGGLARLNHLLATELSSLFRRSALSSYDPRVCPDTIETYPYIYPLSPSAALSRKRHCNV